MIILRIVQTTRMKMPGMMSGVNSLLVLSFFGGLIGIHPNSILAQVVDFFLFLSLSTMISFSLGYIEKVSLKNKILFEIVLFAFSYGAASCVIYILALSQGFNLVDPNMDTETDNAFLNIFIVWLLGMGAFGMNVTSIGKKVRLREITQ